MEEIPVSWEGIVFVSFSKFLRFLIEGFEEEILDLLNQIASRR